MSIHNLPPLITQTPERQPSDEISVATRLGEIGAEKYYDDREQDTAPLTVLPTRDSLRYAMDRIHNVVLVELQHDLDAIDMRLHELDVEREILFDQQQALKERDADLSLFNGGIMNDAGKAKELASVGQAIDARENTLMDEREAVLAERSRAISELEKLEDQDFRLLQQGK